MTDVGKYTPLMRICAYFIDQYSKQGLYDMDKIWILGLRALTELNFDIAAQPKTVRIPVSANKTVPFPIDYIRWVKIGILNNKGEINTLKVNTALTNYADNDVNRLTKLNTPDISDSIGSLDNSGIYSNFYYNDGCYNLFGVGGGVITYGECKVDERNNLIVLPADFRFDSILLEYISSPERDVDYQVQTCLQESVIAFIEAKLKLNTMDNFYAEATKSRRRIKPVILQSINQILRESDGMKLKA
jgi:hypothetical protein